MLRLAIETPRTMLPTFLLDIIRTPQRVNSKHKESLETLYHLQAPRNIEEANEWLSHYLLRYNEGKHRYEKHTRLEDWKRHLGYRAGNCKIRKDRIGRTIKLTSTS